jgi:hypothetical protein
VFFPDSSTCDADGQLPFSPDMTPPPAPDPVIPPASVGEILMTAAAVAILYVGIYALVYWNVSR